MPAARRHGVTGCDVEGVVTDGGEEWLVLCADRLRDGAACAKPTTGRGIYGTGEIAHHGRRRNAAARIHAQAGRDQRPRVRMAGAPVDLLDRSDLDNLS